MWQNQHNGNMQWVRYECWQQNGEYRDSQDNVCFTFLEKSVYITGFEHDYCGCGKYREFSCDVYWAIYFSIGKT